MKSIRENDPEITHIFPYVAPSPYAMPPDRQRTVDLWEDGRLTATLITELEGVPYVNGENRPATKEEIHLSFFDGLGRISPTSWVRFAIPIEGE